MKFSVIIPTCNRSKQLKQCLRSLLAQKYKKKDYEIIIVDDGSDDNTESDTKNLSKDFDNISYTKLKKSGPGCARNQGLRLSKGKYFVFTDDDCIVEKYWLRKIEEAFDRTSADAVGGSIINPINKYIAKSQHILNFSSWLPNGKERYVKDIPTANIAYQRKSVQGHFFPKQPGSKGYEDSLYNFQLYKEKKKYFSVHG